MDNRDALLKAAMEYAGYGWHVVPLRDRSKIPRIREWQKYASHYAEQIEGWWGKWPQANVGVKLGRDSNLVDFEGDHPDSETNLTELFDGDVPITAVYQGARGKHWLFRWRDDLPGGAKFQVGYVEIRTGNDDKGAQSVFPPSIHPNGDTYKWLVPPEAVDIAALPDAVVAKLWNLRGETEIKAESEKKKSARLKLYTQPQVIETTDGRDNTIYAEACAYWREQYQVHGPPCFDSPEVQSTVYRRLWSMNTALCRPPLSDDEILKKCEGGRNFIRAQAVSENGKAKGPTLTSLGLEFRNGEWWPGKWRATAINSTPPVTRLFAPFLPAPGFIDLLTRTEYGSPDRVNDAIRGVTGTVELDDGARPWKFIWRGGCVDKAKKIYVRGLHAKLLEQAEKVEASPERKRQCVIAHHLCEQLRKARDLQEDQDPDTRGRPGRTPSGELVFKFGYVWEPMSKSADQIGRNELSELLQAVGVEKFRVRASTERPEYMKLNANSYKDLERLAYPD